VEGEPERWNTPDWSDRIWERVDNGDVADFRMRLIVTCEHSSTTPPIELVDRAIEIAELTFDRLIEARPRYRSSAVRGAAV
jgi:hypothetical protein